MVENPTADEELPVIARFDVRRRFYLAPDGTVLRRLPDFASDSNLLISLYRAMVQARAFDLKAVSLQRTGRLGTYAVALGQEAASVGIASAMRPEDVLLPSYRDNAALLWRGMKMEEILLFWGGDERGNRSSGPAHDFPYCVPVASQAPHAAGGGPQCRGWRVACCSRQVENAGALHLRMLITPKKLTHPGSSGPSWLRRNPKCA